MSTFHARSAMIELLPWSSIWFGENIVTNLSKIIRLNALHSFPNCELEDQEMFLKTGRTVHHVVANDPPCVRVEAQASQIEIA